ncbi:unnamed protein product [Parajaminaea phylloscopi]
MNYMTLSSDLSNDGVKERFASSPLSSPTRYHFQSIVTPLLAFRASTANKDHLPSVPYGMGKHYCDYCDVYLTHDSVSVRKAHNSGRNHLQNVRDYYMSLDPAQVQAIVDDVSRHYELAGVEKPALQAGPAGGFGGGWGGAGPGGAGGPGGYNRPGFGGPPRGGFAGNAGSGYGRPPPFFQQQQQPGGPPPSGPYGRPQGPPNFSQPPPPLGMSNGATPDYSRPPPPLGMHSRPPPGFNPSVPPPNYSPQPGSGAQSTQGTQQSYPSQPPPSSESPAGLPRPLGMR